MGGKTDSPRYIQLDPLNGVVGAEFGGVGVRYAQ
jgi:hypothetical protein